jgi:hypothetical protein
MQLFFNGTASAKAPGTEEQFVTAFVLMARERGIPARVVVGFSASQKKSRDTVVGERAHAWAEVGLAGLGWVVVDPTGRTGVASDLVKAPEKKTEPAETRGGGGQKKPEPTIGTGGEGSSTADASGTSTWTVVALGALIVVALAGFILLAVWLAKRRRRARRAAGAAKVRVVGAWRESLDRLTEMGFTTNALTADEIVTGVEERFGPEVAEELRPLSRIANYALYSPREPSVEDADRAWIHERSFTTLLSRTRPWHQRVVAAIDPRSLRSNG